MDFKVGDVVYLRGDAGMDTPMTVIDVNVGLGVGVCWFDANKQLCTHYGKADIFATAQELVRLYAEAEARMLEERRQALERGKYREPHKF